jgi:hypothetical protein
VSIDGIEWGGQSRGKKRAKVDKRGKYNLQLNNLNLLEGCKNLGNKLSSVEL